MIRFAIVLFAGSLLSACATNHNTVTATDDDEIVQHQLAGSWSLEELAGKQVNDEEYLRAPFFRLDPAKGKVGGNTSCNNFFGNMSVSGDGISFSELGSTKMFCEKSVEKEFTDALIKATRFEIKGTQLFLYEGDAFLARFVKRDLD